MISPIKSSADAINCYRVLKTAKKTAMLPIVAAPIVYYNTKSDLRERTTKKILEIPKTKKTVTDTEETNLKALKKLGIPKNERNQYLDGDGHINSKKIKDQLNEKDIPFKGNDEETCSVEQPYYCPGEENSVVELDEFKESLPYDTQLSPRLFDVLDHPKLDYARGLMRSVLGEELMNKIEADLDGTMDGLSYIKSMTLDVLGFGD